MMNSFGFLTLRALSSLTCLLDNPTLTSWPQSDWHLLCETRPLSFNFLRVFTGRQHSLPSSSCMSVLASVTSWHCVKKTQDGITKSSPADSPWNLVLALWGSSKNSNGFTPSEGVECEWDRENSKFSANKSSYRRNGARKDKHCY